LKINSVKHDFVFQILHSEWPRENLFNLLSLWKCKSISWEFNLHICDKIILQESGYTKQSLSFSNIKMIKNVITNYKLFYISICDTFLNKTKNLFDGPVCDAFFELDFDGFVAVLRMVHPNAWRNAFHIRPLFLIPETINKILFSIL
jgi:hypothetical protein